MPISGAAAQAAPFALADPPAVPAGDSPAASPDTIEPETSEPAVAEAGAEDSASDESEPAAPGSGGSEAGASAVGGSEAGEAPPPEGSESNAEDGSGQGFDYTRPTRQTVIPTLEIELPEGDLDLRASRLVGRIFFQGQVQYNFVDGDITAFLRYRIYGQRRTYQITGFDEVEFGSVDRLSDEFERVRGLLFLTEWPHDYHRRTTLLAESDRFVSNKPELRFDNQQTNTYLRLGHQVGTPDDERSNAIVGEPRARLDRLFTPLRQLGPYGAGFTTALTYGFDFVGGDYNYVRLEVEGLKRFELPGEYALVGRLHGGTFPYKEEREPLDGEELLPRERYLIPVSELFRLDGRDRLRGLKDRLRGTEELHTTWELFVPWFLDEPRHALGVDWDRWYWVLYGGYGAVGFDSDVFTDADSYFTDLGVGFQASFRYRRHRVFLAALAARTLEGSGDPEFKLSVRTYH